MNTKVALWPLSLFISFLLSSTAHAANVYNLKCIDPKCGYAGTIMIGPLTRYDSISGYCAAEKKFVFVDWLRTEKDKAPKPIKVWDAEKGIEIELYKCPNDANWFLPITRIEQVKYCPLCHKEGVEREIVSVID